MRYFFLLFVLLHGLIHLLGFSKAFGYGQANQIGKEISKPAGLLWLTAALLFVTAAALLWSRKSGWWIPAAAGAVLSQILIFSAWQDAKIGTVANLLVLAAVALGLGMIRFENQFRSDAQNYLSRAAAQPAEPLTEADLQPLPAAVQRYLRYAGVLNKPKVRSAHIRFEGQMRARDKDYFPFTSEQYNCFDDPTRLFFMKGRMFGLSVPGYHRYAEGKAAMDIKLFGLFPIVRESGEVLDKTETVTLFNDMCLLAPATLIDKRIVWDEIDGTTVNAIFTNRGISIAATLHFNAAGQLVDFLSNDRTDVAAGKPFPFSTPVSRYENMNGYNLATYGEAVYEYPEGKLTYGKFYLKSVEYD